MARPSNEQRSVVVETIKRMVQQHGVKEGVRLARAEFPDVSKGNFSRWRVDAIGMTYKQQQDAEQDAQARVGQDVRDNIPVIGVAVAAQADVVPAQRRAIDFWRLIEELDEDAALMRSYAVTVQPDGTRKLRVPFALATAHKMRSDLIRLAMEHASIAWSAERNREFQECVIAAIGEISPDLQKAVIDRLRRLKANNEARYGI